MFSTIIFSNPVFLWIKFPPINLTTTLETLISLSFGWSQNLRHAKIGPFHEPARILSPSLAAAEIATLRSIISVIRGNESQAMKYEMRRWLAMGLLFISSYAFAFLWAGNNEHAILPATGTIQVAFTPGDDAAGLIIGAISQAQRQILVQAFSFTHEGIAKALIAAHKHGVEVKVIADREQTERMERSKVPMLAGAGVPVWIDGEHQSAHNKVMVVDAASSTAVLVTGSYNFTNAAQYKNAENLLLMRGNEKLIKLYRDNWNLHLAHARPYREK